MSQPQDNIDVSYYNMRIFYRPFIWRIILAHTLTSKLSTNKRRERQEKKNVGLINSVIWSLRVNNQYIVNKLGHLTFELNACNNITVARKNFRIKRRRDLLCEAPVCEGVPAVGLLDSVIVSLHRATSFK